MIIAGDIHATLHALQTLQTLATALDTQILQVGDWGGHWTTPCQLHTHQLLNTGPTIWTCGGNHENYEALKAFKAKGGFREIHPSTYFALRPAKLQLRNHRICFFGGAESTDAFYRLEGKNWWREETPTDAEFDGLAGMIDTFKPDIMITHEAPISQRPWRAPGTNPLSNKPHDYTSKRLQQILDASTHKPRYWFYGHHHELIATKTETTQFYCCGLHGQGWLLLDDPTDSSREVVIQITNGNHDRVLSLAKQLARS